MIVELLTDFGGIVQAVTLFVTFSLLMLAIGKFLDKGDR